MSEPDRSHGPRWDEKAVKATLMTLGMSILAVLVLVALSAWALLRAMGFDAVPVVAQTTTAAMATIGALFAAAMTMISVIMNRRGRD